MVTGSVWVAPPKEGHEVPDYSIVSSTVREKADRKWAGWFAWLSRGQGWVGDSAPSALSSFLLHPEVLGWIRSPAKPPIWLEARFLLFYRHDYGVQREETNVLVCGYGEPALRFWFKSVGSSATYTVQPVCCDTCLLFCLASILLIL